MFTALISNTTVKLGDFPYPRRVREDSESSAYLAVFYTAMSTLLITVMIL